MFRSFLKTDAPTYFHIRFLFVLVSDCKLKWTRLRTRRRKLYNAGKNVKSGSGRVPLFSILLFLINFYICYWSYRTSGNMDSDTEENEAEDISFLEIEMLSDSDDIQSPSNSVQSTPMSAQAGPSTRELYTPKPQRFATIKNQKKKKKSGNKKT